MSAISSVFSKAKTSISNVFGGSGQTTSAAKAATPGTDSGATLWIVLGGAALAVWFFFFKKGDKRSSVKYR